MTLPTRAGGDLAVGPGRRADQAGGYLLTAVAAATPVLLLLLLLLLLLVGAPDHGTS